MFLPRLRGMRSACCSRYSCRQLAHGSRVVKWFHHQRPRQAKEGRAQQAPLCASTLRLDREVLAAAAARRATTNSQRSAMASPHLNGQPRFSRQLRRRLVNVVMHVVNRQPAGCPRTSMVPMNWQMPQQDCTVLCAADKGGRTAGAAPCRADVLCPAGNSLGRSPGLIECLHLCRIVLPHFLRQAGRSSVQELIKNSALAARQQA